MSVKDCDLLPDPIPKGFKVHDGKGNRAFINPCSMRKVKKEFDEPLYEIWWRSQYGIVKSYHPRSREDLQEMGLKEER